MKEEFNLREKRKDILNIIKYRYYRNYISEGKILTIKKVMDIVEEQDKEFIKRLKKSFILGMLDIARERDCQVIENILFKKIDKLAGDKLKKEIEG